MPAGVSGRSSGTLGTRRRRSIGRKALLLLCRAAEDAGGGLCREADALAAPEPYRRLVTDASALGRAAARLRTSPLDVGLAVALTALVLWELALDDSGQPVPVVVVTAAATLALAWRRAAPVAVAVVVLLATTLLAVTSDGQFPPQLPFLADLLVLYTAAATLSGRRAWVTAAGTLALVWAAHVATGDGDPGDFLPALVWGAPWAAGRLVRRRTLEAAAAATRAAVVEQQRDEQVRQAAAEERDRIARELHDVVAHGVSLMVVQAGAERLRLGDEAIRTREVLDGIERAGRDALGELRTMLAVLRVPGGAAEADLTPQPTPADLGALVEQVRAAGLQVVLDGDLSRPVPPAVGLSLFRIVQEALTNVLRHAPGTAVTVVVQEVDGALHVEVVNALPAVPVQPAGAGRGLIGMGERAALHGGAVQAGAEGDVWCVRARLPLPLPVAPVQPGATATAGP